MYKSAQFKTYPISQCKDIYCGAELVPCRWADGSVTEECVRCLKAEVKRLKEKYEHEDR
jgi:hypothetical protein